MVVSRSFVRETWRFRHRRETAKHARNAPESGKKVRLESFPSFRVAAESAGFSPCKVAKWQSPTGGLAPRIAGVCASVAAAARQEVLPIVGTSSFPASLLSTTSEKDRGRTIHSTENRDRRRWSQLVKLTSYVVTPCKMTVCNQSAGDLLPIVGTIEAAGLAGGRRGISP
jgi:hypothetical protein